MANFFDTVNERVSIFDLFDEYGVKYYSREISGPKMSCPFHGADTDPSAKVYPETNSLYCWTCSSSWDAISFYAQANGMYKTDESGKPLPDPKGGMYFQLDYAKAAHQLGAKYGISSDVPDWYKAGKQLYRQIKAKQTGQQLEESSALKLVALFEKKFTLWYWKKYPNRPLLDIFWFILSTTPDIETEYLERELKKWFIWGVNLMDSRAKIAIERYEWIDSLERRARYGVEKV